MADFSKVKFDGLNQTEKILYIFHKHWLTDLKEISYVVFLYILPILAVGVLQSYFQFNWYLIWFLLCIYLSFFGLYIFISWIDDAFDVLVISNERIMIITQFEFLKRKLITANLDQIQHVSFTQRGLLDAMFHVGTVTYQTASREIDTSIEAIPNPSKVTDIILDLAKNVRTKMIQ